jgi:D-alanyl-D-alanine carboxypeptidase (penicillin-binding protein 5/6)
MLLYMIISVMIISISNPVVSASQNSAAMPSLDAQGAVLIEQSTGRVLFEKNKDARLYPASTTKILAALVAIENGDLNETVTVGNEANLAALDGSKAGLDIGEQIKLEDLVRGLMLASGNDAGYTIAVHIGRKLSKDPGLSINDALSVFTNLMNQRAAEIGAKNSNFLNPHGYHQENHYTTAYDLALITGEAMRNDDFRRLIRDRMYEYPDWSSAQENPSNPEIRYWVSRNRLLNEHSEFYYPYATGVKTGWTTPAGPCLVSSASKNGLDLISVVLNTSRGGQWLDSVELFEYGFNNYTFHRLVERNQHVGAEYIEGHKLGGESQVNLVTQNGFEDLFRKSDIRNIRKSIKWTYNCPEGESRFVAPITKGQIMGVLRFSLDGVTVFETNLLATEAIEKRTIINTIVYRVQNANFFHIGLQILAGIIIFILILRLVIRFKKKYKFKKKLTFHSFL